MNRADFHKHFKTPYTAILPVVHVIDEEQALRNVNIACREGAQGVFLINHDFSHTMLLPIIVSIRRQCPYMWIGVNFLGVTGRTAFGILGKLAQDGCQVDAYWADNACIEETLTLEEQAAAKEIEEARTSSGWKGLYFGGTAFKCQRHVEDSLVGRAAEIASHFMDVVTTSGSGTGIAANIDKIKDMRRGSWDVAMALASGITPENALSYTADIDCFMVATGISLDFYNIDPIKLRALIQMVRGSKAQLTQSPNGAASSHTNSWYLHLIAANTRGNEFPWLDPTSIYSNGKAMSDLTDDLICQLKPDDIDLVVGIDAMGFPLATAIAAKLQKGFLPIRKGGKLAVDVDAVTYSCYAGSGKVMEMRKNAFKRGTRVLIVDQWMETGGTMKGAIELVQGQGGVVAGIATICMERNTKLCQDLLNEYRIAHVIPEDCQTLFDQHSFKGSISN